MTAPLLPQPGVGTSWAGQGTRLACFQSPDPWGLGFGTLLRRDREEQVREQGHEKNCLKKAVFSVCLFRVNPREGWVYRDAWVYCHVTHGIREGMVGCELQSSLRRLGPPLKPIRGPR